MRHLLHLRKIGISVISAAVLLLIAIVPVTLVGAQSPTGSQASVDESSTNLATQFTSNVVLDGTDISISSIGAFAPAIGVSPNGTYVVVSYFRQTIIAGEGVDSVHVKSATVTDGWLTTDFAGRGSNPSVAFGANDDTVYVAWVAEDGKSIRLSICALSATSSPNCVESNSPIVDVSSDNTVNSVDDPDIVIDGSGNIHVAWEELPSAGNATKIETAFSANNGASWTSSAAGVSVNGVALASPKLAVDGSVLHMVVSQSDAKIGYHKASTGDHIWTNPKTFETNVDVNFQYDELSNPAIVVNGNDVFLAWDGHSSVGTGNDYGLMEATSSDGGNSFLDPNYIWDGEDAEQNLQSPRKVSVSSVNGSPVPLQEEALRPNMAKNGNGYAIVWQERGLDSNGCSEDGNASSEIQYAITSTNWITDVVADNQREYSIDPDIAMDEGNNRRHITFMKSDAPNCIGGGQFDYTITYRGPFTITINDGGEDLTDPGVGGLYLPIVIKS